MMIQEQQLTLGADLSGVRLSRAIVRAGGQVLAEQDLILDETSIQQLLRHGIQTVWVRRLPVHAAEQALVLTSLAQAQRLKYLFRHLGENPSDQFLFNTVARYRRGEAP